MIGVLTSRFLLGALALSLVLAAAATPAAAGRVHVESCRARGDSIELTVRCDVRASPSTVWSVLTDYDGQSRFVPGLRRSQRIATTPEGPVVEQVGTIRTLFVVKEVSARLQMRELAPSRLAFRALSGTFPNLDGMWWLQPLPRERTRILYRCRVGAPSRLPDALLGWLVRQELVPRVSAIGREAERRGRTRR